MKKIFFTASPSSQAAGEAFVRRLSKRKDDLDPVSGPKVASAQIAAFREWEEFKGQRFAELRAIRHPTLVVNGVHDEMIPVSNSYRLGENRDGRAPRHQGAPAPGRSLSHLLTSSKKEGRR